MCGRVAFQTMFCSMILSRSLGHAVFRKFTCFTVYMLKKFFEQEGQLNQRLLGLFTHCQLNLCLLFCFVLAFQMQSRIFLSTTKNAYEKKNKKQTKKAHRRIDKERKQSKYQLGSERLRPQF